MAHVGEGRGERVRREGRKAVTDDAEDADIVSEGGDELEELAWDHMGGEREDDQVATSAFRQGLGAVVVECWW